MVKRLQRQPGQGRASPPATRATPTQEVYRQVRECGRRRPDQLPRRSSTSRTPARRRWSTTGQVLPAEACMEADGYDLTEHRRRRPEPRTRRRRAVPGLHERVDADPLLQQGPLREGRARPREPAARPSTRSTSAAKKLKDAGRLQEAVRRSRPSQWFFETWLSGVGEDMVNNDNGRDEARHRGHVRLAEPPRTSWATWTG